MGTAPHESSQRKWLIECTKRVQGGHSGPARELVKSFELFEADDNRRRADWLKNNMLVKAREYEENVRRLQEERKKSGTLSDFCIHR